MEQYSNPFSTSRYLGEIRKALDDSFVRGTLGSIHDEETELLLQELPAFAVGPTLQDGSADLYLCLFSVQHATLEPYWSPEEWPNEDIEAMTSESFFIGIRVATIQKNAGYGLSISPPKRRHRINYSLEEADPYIVEEFLTTYPTYTWLYRLNEHDETLLYKVARSLARYLSLFESFNFGAFITVLIDGLLLLRLGEGHFANILDEVYQSASRDPPNGHVIDTDGRKVEVLSSKTVDLEKHPLLLAEDHDSHRKVLLQASRGKSLTTEGHKLAATTFDGKKTTTSSGLRVGSPVRVPTAKDMQEAIVPEVSENAIGIPVAPVKGLDPKEGEHYFEIVVEPGVTSLNAAIIGPTRSGKTNFIKTFIVQLARHNLQVEQQGLNTNRFGAIFIDKQGEFATKIKDLHGISTSLGGQFVLLDPMDGYYARIRIEDIPLPQLLDDQDYDKYGQIIYRMIKWACKEKGLPPATEKNGKARNPRIRYQYLTPSILTFLLTIDPNALREFREWDNNTFAINQIQAALRRIQHLSDEKFAKLFQMEYNKGEYKSIETRESLEEFIINAQRKGVIIILNLASLDPVGVQSRESRFIVRYCLNVLRRERKRLFSQLGEKEFRRQAPIFYVIDEEATSELSSENVDYHMWIESVTSASKLLIGNIFVFQSTLGIKPLLLSQLSGFSTIFPIPQQRDRENVLAGAAIKDLNLYEEYLAEGGLGTAVISSEAYGRRGFVVHTIQFDHYLEQVAANIFPLPRKITSHNSEQS